MCGTGTFGFFSDWNFLFKVFIMPLEHPEIYPRELGFRYIKQEVANSNFNVRLKAIEEIEKTKMGQFGLAQFGIY